MVEDFSKKGFIIIRKAISLNLINKIQHSILETIYKKKIKSNKNSFELFSKSVKNLKMNEYQFVSPINDNLYNQKYVNKIFLEKKIYKTFTEILGKDLCYLVDNVLTLNLPDKDTSSKNYHFKDWHQEIWSGADLATLQFWTPLFQKSNNYGQIQVIPGSHKWGHIPHSDRRPLAFPKKFKILETKLNYGDVIIFSTTLVHRSTKTKHPRLALPVLIKNFRFKNRSFEYSRNWKIFSYSEITKIERALGNHYLSPFRVTDEKIQFHQGTIKRN